MIAEIFEALQHAKYFHAIIPQCLLTELPIDGFPISARLSAYIVLNDITFVHCILHEIDTQCNTSYKTKIETGRMKNCTM
jgi:hypothetical protein